MFPEEECHVVQPEPISSLNDSMQIDILVQHVDVETMSIQVRVLCFVEPKRPNTSASLIEEVEHQALHDCVSYLAENDLNRVYAMTTNGTRARLWIYERANDFLDPLFGNQVPSVTEYSEAHSNDAELFRTGFTHIKTAPPPTTGSHPVQQNLEAPHMNQPLAGPFI